MNAPRKIDPFAWRQTPCPDCDDGQVYDYGYGHTARACETCQGDAEIDARCTGCGEDRPLDDEGSCANCAQLTVVIGDPFLGRMM